MAAGLEGAGRDHAFGVNIRLPNEEDANPFIAQDPKLVEMRYFFTRKLMLIKESHAYAILPGGFGTQDEAFELLTLLQTGKAEPAPVVMVETPGGTYWHAWLRFVEEEAIAAGWVSPEDRALFKVTNTMEEASEEVLGFYRNYHSCRWVGDLLVLRVQVQPSKAELADLNKRFADIVLRGQHPHGRPLPARAQRPPRAPPAWPSASTASTTPVCACSSTPSTSARGEPARGGSPARRCRAAAVLGWSLLACAPGSLAAAAPAFGPSPRPPPDSVVPFGTTAIGANAVANPNAPDRGDGGHATTAAGYWLVGSRRRHLQLRRRAVLRLGRLARLNAPIVGMAATPDGAGTGWWPATGASSPTATPGSSARPAR